jgi:hypothetical protein
VRTPDPIKAVEPLDVNDRGEIVIHLSGSPSEEFMEGFRQYWKRPTGSFTTAFERRVFDRFEGTLVVFNKMRVEDFQKHELPVALDAIKHGNEFASDIYAKRDDDAAAREKAKQGELAEIERDRAKAAQVRFE